jgi:hypothetical protein
MSLPFHGVGRRTLGAAAALFTLVAQPAREHGFSTIWLCCAAGAGAAMKYISNFASGARNWTYFWSRDDWLLPLTGAGASPNAGTIPRRP